MSRLVVWAEMKNGLIPHPWVGVDNWEDYLSYRDPPWGERCPRLIPEPPTQVFSAGKRSRHNFWQWKPAEIVTEWGTGLLGSQVFLIEKLAWTYLQTDSLMLGQHLERFQGHNIQGETELSGFRQGWKGSFLLERSAGRSIFLEMPYLSLHQSGRFFPDLMIPWYPASPNLLAHPTASNGFSRQMGCIVSCCGSF